MTHGSVAHGRRLLIALFVLASWALPAMAQESVPEVVRELLDEADRHREAGRTQQAITSYQEALRLGPSVREGYLALGALWVQQGELESALETFGNGLEAMPHDRQLLFNAAVVGLRLERFEAALGHVERALARHRGDPDLHSLHSAVLGRLERYEEALEALEVAIKRKPGDPQILFRLGNLQHQLGQPEAAVESFRKAVKKDRSLLRAYYNLGAVLLELGRYDEALDAYLVALEPFEDAFATGSAVDAAHAPAYLNLGAIYFQKEEWEPALDAYGKALRLDPQQISALYNQGFVQFRLGRFEAAEATYRKALAIDPELPVAYLHLGQMARRQGALDEAVRWLNDGLPRFDAESRLVAWRVLAESQDALGRLAEAEKAYRSLLAARPGEISARLALGRLLRRSERLGEARQELEQARRAAPEDPEVALELASLAQIEGRTADERRLYEEILERSGSKPEIWPVRLNLALLHLRQGEVAPARSYLEQLAARGRQRQAARGPGPDEQRLIATLNGLLLALDGDLAAARTRLRAVLDEANDFVAASDLLAVLAVLEGETGTTELATSYERRKGGALEATARANLGQALWLSGQSAAARPHLEAAVDVFPRWLSLRGALGAIALEEGRFPDAIRELGRATEQCGSGGDGSLLAGAPGVEGVFHTRLTAAPGGDGRSAFC
ncbi:MAG: tetratricopeptide repeat protein, partial [Acidobacteriota bacterium]